MGLTFNLGTDRTPAWLPDGSGILYSLERVDRPDLDRCLGLLPAQGGSLRRVVCHVAAAAGDSVDVFEWPAVAPDGRLVYVEASGLSYPFRSIAPTRQALALGTLDLPTEGRVIQAIGYTMPSGRIHDGVSHVRWLDDTRLVFLGDSVRYPRTCLGCFTRDTIRTGIEIVTLDLSGPTPTLGAVPGTDDASSVASEWGASGDTIYYSVTGDSRVLRFSFSSGLSAVVHDFGAAGIARDVQVAGSKLIAVVGGDIPLGGGYLHLVNLAAGTDSVLADSSFRFRHPAIAPDGTRVVAEVVTNGLSDLWLLELP